MIRPNPDTRTTREVEETRDMTNHKVTRKARAAFHAAPPLLKDPVTAEATGG